MIILCECGSEADIMSVRKETDCIDGYEISVADITCICPDCGRMAEVKTHLYE